MIIVYLILSFSFGLIIWYLYFYYQFGQRDIVNNLSSSNNKLKEEMEKIEHEKKEYEAQNEVLLDSIKKARQDNYDLKNVVWELSKYQYAVRVWWELAAELLEKIAHYDPNIIDLIQDLQNRNFEYDDWTNIESSNNEEKTDENKKTNKKFF